jgi:hypothetical protein
METADAQPAQLEDATNCIAWQQRSSSVDEATRLAAQFIDYCETHRHMLM